MPGTCKYSGLKKCCKPKPLIVILTSKVRKTLDIATRLTIAVMALTYIFYRVYTLPAGQVQSFFVSVLYHQGFTYISISLFLLMLLNWALEALKWKLLIAQSEKVSFLKAYQAVLGGLAVSIFTPNRVGEFLGRVFILKKTEPVKAILLTVVGSFSQLLVTIVAGTLAYLFFAPNYLPVQNIENFWLVKGLSYTLVIVSAGLVAIYFNIRVLHHISLLIPEKYAEHIKNGINAMADCPPRLLLKTVLYSAMRYIVFTFQFILAIRLMQLDFSVVQCVLVIPVIYLALAAIPTGVLTELGVRGSVSVFMFGLMKGAAGLDAATSLAIISVSTLIWILNVAVPSLAGVPMVFRLKFFRR